MVRRFVANTGMEKQSQQANDRGWRDKQPRHAAKPCLQSNSETILNLGQYVNVAPVLLILYSGRELRNFCLPFSSSVFGSDIDDAGTLTKVDSRTIHVELHQVKTHVSAHVVIFAGGADAD